MFMARCLLVLCGLGVIAAVICWWLTGIQARSWERMRQEVRERLDSAEFFPEEFEEIVYCEKHGTVSPDYCATCVIEELVEPRLRPGGVVVH